MDWTMPIMVLDLLGFLDNDIVGALFLVQCSGLALDCFQIRSHIGDVIFVSDFDTFELENLEVTDNKRFYMI